MSRPTRMGLDDLPLFADDKALARAVVGSDEAKVRKWLDSLPVLETYGFPPDHMGFGRYVPAVRQFYDRECAPKLTTSVGQGRGEDPASWTSRRSVRRA